MTTATDEQPGEILAGGTDLLERLRSGLVTGPVQRLPTAPELRAIALRRDGGLSIGAAVTIDALASDARIVAGYAGLAATAAGLATPEIRRMATIGGNLAQRNRCWYYRQPAVACLKKGGATCPARTGNQLYAVAFDLGPCIAPHASSMAAALLAYDATVTTSVRDRAALAELLGTGRDGTRDNLLRPGEVITTIDLPPPPATVEHALYRRAIARAAAEWPLAELVVRIGTDAGVVRLARVAAGGVAPVPLRLTGVERELMGARLEALPIARARQAAIEGAAPPAGAAYKLALLQGLVEDALDSVQRTATR